MAKIAMIGLGNMGSGMCANLVKAGNAVRAYDLNQAAVKDAVKDGAQGTESIANAVAEADAVVTMLPAGEHVHDVYFGVDGIAGAAPAGALFIDCSTIAVEDARSASERADAAGFAMVDAPVSGGVAAAAGGALTFMVGGPSDAFERAKPVLETMGKTIVHAGAAGNGQVAKIANNMLLGISMIATCEAFDLAEKLGLDTQTFFDISSKASGQNWSMTSYCPAPGPVPTSPANKDYAPGFAVDMMLKDLRLAASAAETAEANSRLGSMAATIYEALSEQGLGGKDFSVVMQELRGGAAG
ncbi:MAG: 3-hydroxyisobutyrate dehydrogenase [Pseudomonadota bacterium]